MRVSGAACAFAVLWSVWWLGGFGFIGASLHSGASGDTEPSDIRDLRLTLFAPASTLESVLDETGLADLEVVENPSHVTVTVPDLGRFRAYSQRTTLWFSAGRLTMVTLLPMQEVAEFKDVKHRIDRLLDRWEIADSLRKKARLDRWEGINPRTADEFFWDPGRSTMRLSPKVHLVANIRPAADGWFMAIDFSVSGDERTRMRRAAEAKAEAQALVKVEKVLLKGADTPAERFSRIEQFLARLDDDGEAMDSDTLAALANLAVVDGGASGIELLQEADVNWIPAALENREALRDYLKTLEPKPTVRNETLFRRLRILARSSENVERLFFRWIEQSDAPTVVEKSVHALASVHGTLRRKRLLPLLEDERAVVRTAAARELGSPLAGPESVRAIENLLRERRAAGADAEEIGELQAIVERMRRVTPRVQE